MPYTNNKFLAKETIKATIPDIVPVILTWVSIIITVSVYSYNIYNS